jgi:hypothetical protein
MPLRVLQHGCAGDMDSVGLVPGAWSDVAQHGQFLLDLEFLLRCAPASGTSSCIYCKSPPYLKTIADHFPWIHFYAYEQPADEYDPAQPDITRPSQFTVQVEHNRTMSCLEFTKDMARTMGERSARDRESLLLICHGLDSMRQVALQVLMRPVYALLDVCGPIPAEYLEGDLILPIFIPKDKVFLGLVARQNAKGRAYDPSLLVREVGFFQGVIRSTHAYDESSKDSIAAEYAKYTHRYHGCAQELVKASLLSAVDILWATGNHAAP